MLRFRTRIKGLIVNLFYTVIEFDQQFYIFWNFADFLIWWNSNLGSDKTKFFFDKVTFTLRPLVVLIHNTTTAK